MHPACIAKFRVMHYNTCGGLFLTHDFDLISYIILELVGYLNY